MQDKEKTFDIPWVEKYRPKTLSDVLGHEEITRRLSSYAKTGNLPNLLFSGPAGVGKTSAAVSLAYDIYKTLDSNFLELNASDSRRIDDIRTIVKDFARTMSFNSPFKIIFLDESDALTPEAQQALRRIMEKYSQTARFILNANYSSKIIEPIQSRCVVFRFRPLSPQEIKKALKKISEKESLQMDENSYEAIIYVSQGDLRKAINILQASASLSKTIKAEDIYKVSSQARPEEIKSLISLALEKKFLEARKNLYSLMYDYGMSAEDIVIQIYREVVDSKELDEETRLQLIDKIATYNFRIVEGANEHIQMEALLSQFMLFSKKST